MALHPTLIAGNWNREHPILLAVAESLHRKLPGTFGDAITYKSALKISAVLARLQQVPPGRRDRPVLGERGGCGRLKLPRYVGGISDRLCENS